MVTATVSDAAAASDVPYENLVISVVVPAAAVAGASVSVVPKRTLDTADVPVLLDVMAEKLVMFAKLWETPTVDEAPFKAIVLPAVEPPVMVAVVAAVKVMVSLPEPVPVKFWPAPKVKATVPVLEAVTLVRAVLFIKKALA